MMAKPETNAHARVIDKLGKALGLHRDLDETWDTWIVRVRFAFEQAWTDLQTLERDAALLRRVLHNATAILIEDRLL